MSKSLWNADARQEVVERLDRLKPDAAARWGRMNAPQMLAHILDWMRMLDSELTVLPRKLPLRFPVVKQLLIYVLPFPKGVPTAPELRGRSASDWAAEHAEMCERVRSFETLHADRGFPDHPAFGRLTARAWGVLGYRHTDHHLRQFGV